MRKLSLPVRMLLVFCMVFGVGLSVVSAQVEIDCSRFEGTYNIIDAVGIEDVQFSNIDQNQTWYVTSSSSPNHTVVVVYFDWETGDVVNEQVETLPITIASANGNLNHVLIITQDGAAIDWVVELTCGVEYLSCPIDDGRINTDDCGALVAAYPNGNSLDLYGIDPASGEGVLVFSFDLATAGDVTENTLLAEGTNPFNGQPIRLYKLAGGGYQLNTTQPNGGLYEFAWS